MCLRGERPPPPPASTPSIGSSHSLSKKRGLGRGLMSGRSQACAFLVLIAVFLPGVCPASSSQPPPRLGGGGRWGLEGHILFVPQLLLAMGRRKAVVGQLLELRGAASRHSDGREDKRDSSQRLRQHRAVPSTTFGGLGNQSPAPPPPLVGPPLPMGSPRSTTMGEVHGVNQWGGEAWHGEQNGPALLAGQIGKWQKLRARKDGAVKIKCGMCIVPPVEIWDQIQAVRRNYDRHHARWMPHINLFYPVMLTESQVEELPRILSDALSNSPAFNVSLDSFGTFHHPLSSLLWAGPNAGEYELRQLHYILSQVLPASSPDGSEDLETLGRVYEPHMCLGQWTTEEALEEALREISREWRPLNWEVKEVFLVASVPGKEEGEFTIKCGVPLTEGDWTAFTCPLQPPKPRPSKFQRFVELPHGRHVWTDGEMDERDRLAILASSLRSLGDGAVRLKTSRLHLNITDDDSNFLSSRTPPEAKRRVPMGAAGRWGGVQKATVPSDGESGSESSEDVWEGERYEEMYMPAGPRVYRPPDALSAPPLLDASDSASTELVVTFADLPPPPLPGTGYNGGGGAYAKPTLEELVLEHARSSLHGMKSRILPRAAKVLLSSNVPEGEVEWLKAMLDKRRGFVDAREAVLRSKVVFNRKVAAAMGSETKGQVSLDKVRGHTWRNVIVEARREFFVNKLRLEAFETEERQARRWSAAMTRDVVQHLTMLNAQEVRGLLSRREEWCRVKDVLQTQGNLRLDQSVVSLLENCDLEASEPLAFDLVMAMSDYGHAGTTVGWDEQINSKREGAVFKMDINDGLPGWYVYYDMYGWC